MGSIYDLKPRFQDLLRPLMLSLREAGATPNQLTLAALALSIATGLLVWAALSMPILLLLVPLALFLRMALNALDGMMARECHLESPLGRILNELGDVVSDTAIFLPFALHCDNGWPVVLFAILAILSEFTGLLGASVSGERVYDGPMGKSDRAFAIGLFALLLFHWPGLACAGGLYFHALSALTLWSIRNRIVHMLDRVQGGL